MVFVFQSVYMVDYIDRFSYFEPSLHVRNEPYLFMVNDFLIVLGFSLPIFYLVFASVFYMETLSLLHPCVVGY